MPPWMKVPRPLPKPWVEADRDGFKAHAHSSGNFSDMASFEVQRVDLQNLGFACRAVPLCLQPMPLRKAFQPNGRQTAWGGPNCHSLETCQAHDAPRSRAFGARQCKCQGPSGSFVPANRQLEGMGKRHKLHSSYYLE